MLINGQPPRVTIGGTVDAPGLALVSDPTVGLYDAGGGTLGIAASGTNQASIFAGSVEIAVTLQADQTLTVSGDASVQGTLEVNGPFIGDDSVTTAMATINSPGKLQLGNAFVAGAVVATGSVQILDTNGVACKVPAVPA
jgi:hypothetical protein